MRGNEILSEDSGNETEQRDQICEMQPIYFLQSLSNNCMWEMIEREETNV